MIKLPVYCMLCLVCLMTGNLHFACYFQEFYPANFIRTVALNGSCTSYVFLSDGDFVPVQNSELRMMDYIKNHGVLSPGEKHVRLLCYARLIPSPMVSRACDIV